VLDDVEVGQGKDQPSSGVEEVSLAPNEFGAEMPGKNEKIVRPGGATLGFRNDGNARQRRPAPPFLRVALSGGDDLAGVELAILQQRIALGGRAVKVSPLSPRLLGRNERHEVVPRLLDSPLECVIRCAPSEPHVVFQTAKASDRLRSRAMRRMFSAQGQPKASAVACVELDIENAQTGRLGEPFDLP